jgi:N-acyl-D-amino-acid deacylase
MRRPPGLIKPVFALVWVLSACGELGGAPSAIEPATAGDGAPTEAVGSPIVTNVPVPAATEPATEAPAIPSPTSSPARTPSTTAQPTKLLPPGSNPPPVATPIAPAATAPPATAALPAFDDAMAGVIALGYPGGSLAVMRDGKLVYARGYGYANVGMAATASTRYRQASVSKAVTGSLLARLVAAGTISLDLKVFPFLGVVPADPRANTITVRMLRDHTSGFAADYFLFEPRKAATFYSVASPPDADTMVRWTAHYPLASDPGTSYKYNNTNYAVLSRIIERATGRAWIDLVTEMVRPLGIASWRLGPSLSRPPDEARYYEADPFKFGTSVFDSVPGTVEAPYGTYDAVLLSGAVALVSTVVDMARYDQAVAMGEIPAPETSPIPTRPGWNYTYVYNGSMPGHYTFVMRVWNGAHLTIIAGAFNHRDAGPLDASINQRLLDAYGATTDWPTLQLPGY